MGDENSIIDVTPVVKKRSRTGCFTCRQRKVRCDEQHPVCRACCRLSLACSYPPPSSKRSSPGPRAADSGWPQRRRHHVKTPTHMKDARVAFPVSPHLPSPAFGLTSGAADQGTGENAGLDAHASSNSWWSSLDEGLLDVNWLEHWIPEEDDLFGDLRHSKFFPAPEFEEARPVPRPVNISRNVTILPHDREILQHFTTTMVRFCILRNTAHDNLYTYILINMGLFHSSLYDAMMAYSALHLAHIRQKSNQSARDRYDLAYTALIEDLANNVAPSLLLATIWFLMQYQLILAEGVDGFTELINLASDVARAELQNGDVETAMTRIGPVGSLVLVWMSARDSQAAYLGMGGKLLGCLRTYPHIYELVDASSVSDDVDTAADIVFLEREQISSPRRKPSDMQACMRLSFRNVTVTGQIKILGSNPAQRANIPAWDNIRTSLGVLRREIEQDDTAAAKAALGVATGSVDAMPVVDPIGYNRLLLLASYYKTLINYHNHRPSAADDFELLCPEECADRIIRLSRRVCSGRPNSPQGIWPTHILIAAITTRDPVYQEWAIHAFEKAERWGANYVKTRKLLEAVIQRQTATGERVDLIEVMKETTGLFIL